MFLKPEEFCHLSFAFNAYAQLRGALGKGSENELGWKIGF